MYANSNQGWKENCLVKICTWLITHFLKNSLKLSPETREKLMSGNFRALLEWTGLHMDNSVDVFLIM